MQHTAINLVSPSWGPSNSWIFIHSYIVALDLFCCHCRRCSYVSCIRFLNCASPAEECKQSRPLYVSIAMAGKKITLDEEGISEILVADTNSESGSEASDFWKRFWRGGRRQSTPPPSPLPLTTTTTSLSRYWNTGHNEWWITNLGTTSRKEHKYSSFCRSSKRCEKSEAPHINKDSSPLSVLMLFFTEMFHLLVEQTNLYYEQFLDRQAGPSRRLPDITLPDMIIFIALALQMGHVLKDTHTIFCGDHDTRHVYTYYIFCISRTIHRDLTKAKNMTDCGN